MPQSETTLTLRCGALRCRMEGFDDPFTALGGLAPWLRGAMDGAELPGWARAERRGGEIVLSPAAVEAPRVESPQPGRGIAGSPFSAGGAPWATLAPEGDGEETEPRESGCSPDDASTLGTAPRGPSEADVGPEDADAGILARIAAARTAPSPEAIIPPSQRAPDREEVSSRAACDEDGTADADRPEKVTPEEASWEDTVVRLSEAAEARLDGPEAGRRRASLSRLRDAARTTSEDHAEGRGPGRGEPPYRSDLDRAMRVHRLTATATGEDCGDQTSPLLLGPAVHLPPLVLRADQRVDDAHRRPPPGTAPAAPADDDRPIRPRRVRR